MKKYLTLVIFFIAVAMICTVQISRAQDPVKVAPDNYKVIYENETVRVLEFNDKPGDKIQRHSHPNYLVYVVSNAKRLFTTGGEGDDCKGGDSAQKTLTADEKIPSNGTLIPPVTHCEENIGTTNTRLIVVEFKPATKTTTTTTTTTTTITGQN